MSGITCTLCGALQLDPPLKTLETVDGSWSLCQLCSADVDGWLTGDGVPHGFEPVLVPEADPLETASEPS